MSRSHLAIVGAGPWGTYALERLAAVLSGPEPVGPLRISVFERSGHFGDGDTHSQDQAPTSYLNRVASQIAFACDESNTTGDLLPAAARKNFVEWSRERFEATGDPRFDLQPDEVPHRYLHGLALREAFNRFLAIARGIPGVEVDLHATEVTDISEAGDGSDGLLLHTGHATVGPVQHVLLVTGHSDVDPAPGSRAELLARHAGSHPGTIYVDQPYPLRERLTDEILPPGHTVALLGMGLTAVDVILHLTEGRGGTFEALDPDLPSAGLRYRPGGREPRILPLSPSGLFFSSRATNQKARDATGRNHAGLEHQPQFFTREVIRRLRAEHGRPAQLPGGQVRQLDFDRHVFPLVILEMAYVYYRTLLGPESHQAIHASMAPAHREFLRRGGVASGGDPDATIDDLLSCTDDWVRKHGESVHGCGPATVFDWRRFLEPLRLDRPVEPSRWRSALIDQLRADNAAAAEGNLTNPAKAACDGVWRDQRAVFSEVLDSGGLTASSHRRMIEHHLRSYARMSNGTGLEPMQKILALAECGILDVSVGPSPVVEPVPGQPGFRIRGPITGSEFIVPAVVEGRAHRFDAARDRRPLYPRLLRRGTVRRWRNPRVGDEPAYEPGGLDVNDEFHPRSIEGTPDQRITILGSPLEGVLFFQLTAARPHSGSPVLNNIARWAARTAATVRRSNDCSSTRSQS